MFGWLKKLFKGSSKNLGHRLGYELTDKPENSIGALFASMDSQRLPDFKYWEFDVVESIDKRLFVYHDATKNKGIDRMCPNNPWYGEDRKLYELTCEEIKKLKLLDTQEIIPKVNHVLYLLKIIAIKPVNVEIKKLLTMDCQKALIDMVDEANIESNVKFYFSMFKSKYRRMPNKEWFKEMCDIRDIEFKLMGF